MIKTLHLLDRFAELTGKLIAPLTLLMVLLTGVVVVGRYLFSAGLIPVQELVVYLHGIVFMAGIAYTLKSGGHVRVDILYQRFSPRVKAFVDLVGTLAFLFPVGIFIFWTSLDYVELSFRMREGSAEPGGLPALYLLKALIPLMALLLLVQGIAEILRSATVLAGKDG